MGVGYRAVDTRLERPVAIKVLRPEATTDVDRRRRFIQEARAASALNHSHTVTIYEVDEHEGTTFMAMELVDGMPLDQLIAAGPLPIRSALLYASQISSALEAAHAAGSIHRDIKPANIVICGVTADGLVRRAGGHRLGGARRVWHLANRPDATSALGAARSDPGDRAVESQRANHVRGPSGAGCGAVCSRRSRTAPDRLVEFRSRHGSRWGADRSKKLQRHGGPLGTTWSFAGPHQAAVRLLPRPRHETRLATLEVSAFEGRAPVRLIDESSVTPGMASVPAGEVVKRHRSDGYDPGLLDR
ncbi:MAG: serine/threonine protein kinase [Acidobacteria bacterium]|nr:serine/threonine protein kinase [Acidobacteriota bacterium]